MPFFDVYDPRFADFGVPVAVRGTVSFGIADYREFIKLQDVAHLTLTISKNKFVMRSIAM